MNRLKDILLDLGVWLLFGLTVLGAVLLYLGFEVESMNTFFFIVGSLLLIPALVTIIWGFVTSKKYEEERKERFQHLLKTGDKIIVDLEKVVVKSNSYLKEIEVGSGKTSRLETIQVHHNALLFKVNYKGQEYEYRTDVQMAPESLRMYFAIHGKTTLYLDPNNPYNYYFDLRFLDR